MQWTGLLPEEIGDFELMSDEECWLALGAAPFGRLAVHASDGVDVFPVNFMITKNQILLRTAPGSKLIDIVSDPSVAFEVDGSAGRAYWSVVVRGTAERLVHDRDITSSGVLELETLTSSSKWNYIRITASAISGRRFIGAHD